MQSQVCHWGEGRRHLTSHRVKEDRHESVNCPCWGPLTVPAQTRAHWTCSRGNVSRSKVAWTGSNGTSEVPARHWPMIPGPCWWTCSGLTLRPQWAHGLAMGGNGFNEGICFSSPDSVADASGSRPFSPAKFVIWSCRRGGLLPPQDQKVHFHLLSYVWS